MLPDSPPVITRDFDGWRVSLVRGGRVHTYLCETQAEAERFAGMLAKPLLGTSRNEAQRNQARSGRGGGGKLKR